MPKIVTRTIKTTEPRRMTAKRAANELAAYNRRQARQAAAERTYSYRSDGITRCSACPPRTFCGDCAAINKARIYAGLVHPKEDPRPSPNNCVNPVVSGTYKGSLPYPHDRPGSAIVSLEIIPLGGGWFESQTLLGKDTIYRKKCRGRDAALTYARQSMVCIRQGLQWERENG